MNQMNRRQMLEACALSAAGVAACPWLPSLASAVAAEKAKGRHCILLWMPGGPSQTDTFDMKPGHANGGEFQPTSTSVPGMQISEHLPKLAKQAERLAIVRSLSTSEGDHNRGTYLMHTGHRPGGPLRHPTLGSLLSKELGGENAELPNFVSISPYTAFNRAAYGPGFLGPRYAPLTVGANARTLPTPRPRGGASSSYAELGVDDLKSPGVQPQQAAARLELRQALEHSFLTNRRAASPLAHQTIYQRALRMMRSEAAQAFDLSRESSDVREAYGRGRFGQGCLMARRLIEKGVPFIELSLRGSSGGALGWDTHTNNFARLKALLAELDAGWSTLMSELDERGLLESTTILWMGEFGRTPKINRNGGRDHFPRAWSCVFAGGGIQGGRVIGQTSPDGQTVQKSKANVGDVVATLCRAVGLEHEKENIAGGRPVALAEGSPIPGVVG